MLESSDCEEVTVLRDRRARAVAVIALHDTRRGPAHGGIRRFAYPRLEDAVSDVVALARAMSRKCALAGVGAGGGKAVILDHPDLDRAGAYRLVGRAVERLGGRFFTGPDVGTTMADLQVVSTCTRYVATGAPGSGPGDLAVATATGVFSALAALAERLDQPLAGLRVTVQGVGAVGLELCAALHEAGAELLVSDVSAERAAVAAERFGARVLAPDAVLTEPCDVFAPCAMGHAIDRDVADRLPARGVCGAANNVFADTDAPSVLHARGVVAVPDFLANAGALIVGADFNLEGRSPDLARVRRIAATTSELLERSRREDRPPIEVAREIADERLAAGSSRGNVGSA